MTTRKKERWTYGQRSAATSARVISFSLYPEQYELLVGREKSLNVGRSFLIRVLLEIEQREELLRKEMVRRLALQPVDQEKEKVDK